MYFAHPYWLILLLGIPVLIWWELRRLRMGGPAVRYSSLRLMDAVNPSWRVRMRPLLGMLRVIAVALVILALARPQQRNVIVNRSAEGIDVMLVLDTSTSMRAQDFYPNRFEAARDVAAEFIRGRRSDRLGLIVFAGQAYTQAPLTTDYPFLLRMLEEVRIGVVEDGTAIGNALAMAVNRLKDGDSESKVIILLTDGQNNRGEIDPLTAAEIARALDVRIYTVGVGRVADAEEERTGPLGGRRSPPIDIDEESLRLIARMTGGEYFHAGNRETLRAVYHDIDEMEKTEVEETRYTEYAERFAFFLWPALGLFLLEVLLSSTSLRIWP